ncbi:uncharacterized protein EV154DRAFT_560485 [Mucor mucedo]|uniref:uncharacterized protein n=1 Tax=Mucor mucedo TaxID=29922 RepID=UPI002220D536|nr:uncharacterized protein EV154DRAFT_560485 [Mucor mucedo]KAI7894260.1 hypothetical protein EV154DRAFT_560485 [Mucor mucedo]
MLLGPLVEFYGVTQGKICWLGEDEDPKKAIFWFTAAKESCRRHGCYLIGLMHFSDDQDYYVAMQCFEKAANAGHPDALAMLAVIFRDGVLVDKNFKKALNYAERSLEMNQSAGMYLIMGCIYDSGGYGIKQDCKRAFNMYTKAAEKKDGLAACILGVYYMVGHKHIRRDDRKAFEWFQKSAKYGYGDGQFLLSLYYLRGTFVRRDVEYAKRLQREALMNGSEIAAEHILGVDLLNMFMAMQFLSLE